MRTVWRHAASDNAATTNPVIPRMRRSPLVRRRLRRRGLFDEIRRLLLEAPIGERTKVAAERVDRAAVADADEARRPVEARRLDDVARARRRHRDLVRPDR